MKKNLLSLIGSILGFCSVFFIGAPYFIVEHDSSSYLNSFTKDSVCSSINLITPGGLFFTISLFTAFISLFIVILGILRNKNVSEKILLLSSVNVFTLFFQIDNLKVLIAEYEKSYVIHFSVGWGIIVILILFLLFFILSFINFMLNEVSIRNNHENTNFDQIYLYKKLLDDEIITQEEFEEKKRQYIL